MKDWKETGMAEKDQKRVCTLGVPPPVGIACL